MDSRTILKTIKNTAENATDKIKTALNTAADEVLLTDKEKTNRDLAVLAIKAGQYLSLGIATFLLLRNEDIRPGIAVAIGALFFEKGAAQVSKRVAKNDGFARHLEANYSHLTKLTSIFNPIVNAISKDAENLENRGKTLGKQ